MKISWLHHAVSVILLWTETFANDRSCDPSKWKLPVDAKYDTAGKISNAKLNVHLIPHSHDDPGWLMNVDEYYMTSVQYILDTVVEELLHNPDRKFMFVEQSFFTRWYNEQSAATKKIVKKLVKEGRLDLTVNGGWCMHDEAAPHFSAMVDQTAYGHQFLKKEFNVTPRIGWQIDPFGHSSTQGSLLSAGVDFDALYFARIDYQDYDNRKANKDLEMIWRPSKSRGKSSQVFTGAMQNHYGAPDHFHFQHDTQIQDDPALHDFNVCQEIDTFVNECLERGKWTKGNHIFLPMGDDFSYDNARKWFKNMDKLIHYANQDARVNVLYSNLSYYTDLKRAENITWSVKTDDFFPYGSDQHAYWSGYFTSRPALKKFARVSNVLMQQIRQIDAVFQSHHQADLDALKRAVGLVQHHDAISGTEKQAVSDDYALRLNNGVIAAEKGLNEILFVIGEKEQYKLCLQTNVSICDVSTTKSSFEVLVHNALPRKAVQRITVPLKHSKAQVDSFSGDAKVLAQHVIQSMPVHPDKHDEAPYTLIFSAELKPLTTHYFKVEQSATESLVPNLRGEEKKLEEVGESIVLENDLVSVEICKTTGSMTSITNKQKKTSIPVTSELFYYQAFQDEHSQRSGAYVFRPDSKRVYPLAGKDNNTNTTVELLDLSTSTEVKSLNYVAFKIGGWATLLYRLNPADNFVEVEWTVGSIPIDDKIGKEVIFRFDTHGAVKSDAKWYTDSNGLEFVERIRNFRPTWNLTLHDEQEFVAANYFPITTGVYIKDESKQFSIVTDRAQGVASLADGQVEVMLHRRLLTDDAKGVDQHLNETETFVNPLTKKEVTTGLIVRGNLYINVDTAADGMQSVRTRSEKQFFEPLVAFRASKSSSNDVGAKDPWLQVKEFPENVGLHTLEELSKECVFTRLLHLYSIDEHTKLSQTVTVDFSDLFTVKNNYISSVTEQNLAGTAPVTTEKPGKKKPEWKTMDSDVDEENPYIRSEVDGMKVELQAMELRAFKVCFAKVKETTKKIQAEEDNHPVGVGELIAIM